MLAKCRFEGFTHPWYSVPITTCSENEYKTNKSAVNKENGPTVFSRLFFSHYEKQNITGTFLPSVVHCDVMVSAGIIGLTSSSSGVRSD